MRSESTRFLGQPRLTNAKVFPGAFSAGRGAAFRVIETVYRSRPFWTRQAGPALRTAAVSETSTLSFCRVSGVHHQVLPRDERRILGGEKQDGVGNFAGLAQARDHVAAAPGRVLIRRRAVHALFPRQPLH